MKIIFIRHGDPDYKNDSLTVKGKREALLLSNRVMHWKESITHIYCSPLGRAKETCRYSLEKLNMEATELDWLKEFYYPTTHSEQNNEIHVPWDFYPESWTVHDELYDKDRWTDSVLLSENPIKVESDYVFEKFDNLLSQYGYIRKDNYYIHNDTKDDITLVFYCHLGVSLLIMGHLLGISPFVLWHSVYVAPTSVSVIGCEERAKGKASFRIQYLGDTSHLTNFNEPASKSGYFTDCFQDCYEKE